MNFELKFRHYNLHQVKFALKDCHAALVACGVTPQDPYGRKLWAEIDALRARYQQLTSEGRRSSRDDREVA